MSHRCTWTWPNASRCGQLAQFLVYNKSRNQERRPCPRHLAATVKQISRISNVRALRVEVTVDDIAKVR